MRGDTIFNRYFLYLFLFVINCFGQEHLHDHVTDSIESNKIIENDVIPQTYWPLPKQIEPRLEWFPEFLKAVSFQHINDREPLMNTIWFGSIGTMCFLLSLIFLSMGTKRLRQNKYDQKIRTQCQQLQQHNDQVEFEYATLQRKHQKLLNEMEEMKSLSVHYEDNISYLHKKCSQLQEDLKAKDTECIALQEIIDGKQDLIEKHEIDMQKQLDVVTCLNKEILGYQQELEKDRRKINQLQSHDLSLEHFERLQEAIDQLKQDKSTQADQLKQVQDHANQLDIQNNELTIKLIQLKDLFQHREEIIARIPDEILNDILLTVAKTNSDNNQQLLLTIDNDTEKANQRIRHLHTEIENKTRRVKELDALLNQEKDRCRELETKLKVVLELRERDTHLHIRQLGQTDVELRKARTDTECIKILQQQLELNRKQLDDVQKVLASEQTKFSEERSKLQHETHEKWMELIRVTRELDGARKECEGLRRQITKYANNDRSSQEKTIQKSVPQPQPLNNSSSAKK